MPSARPALLHSRCVRRDLVERGETNCNAMLQHFRGANWRARLCLLFYSRMQMPVPFPEGRPQAVSVPKQHGQ